VIIKQLTTILIPSSSVQAIAAKHSTRLRLDLTVKVIPNQSFVRSYTRSGSAIVSDAHRSIFIIGVCDLCTKAVN
jgi:hypothetical protein